jgi:PAS domain S-box-containing protein
LAQEAGPDGRETSPYIAAILQHTPNGVLLVDKDTLIQFVNPAFRRMFHCEGQELLGKPAARYVYCDCFERAIEAGGNLMLSESVPNHEVSFRAGLFRIEGEDLYCGIFIDISEEEKAKKELRDLRAQTLERAQEVITRQMKTAQEIARLLGETTAETKILLVKLMSLMGEEETP